MRIGEMTRSATLADYLQLTKPRITFMVVLTTLAGFYVASAGAMDVPLLLHTLIGTALVVASSNTLNQLLERDADARMRRTQNRPPVSPNPWCQASRAGPAADCEKSNRPRNSGS